LTGFLLSYVCLLRTITLSGMARERLPPYRRGPDRQADQIIFLALMICIPRQISAVNGSLDPLKIEGDDLSLYAWFEGALAVVTLSIMSWRAVEKPVAQRTKAWVEFWRG
jgi:hypothetical protein